MGLFGGKKTYVASTCYNLAGEVADRPDYLKTTVVGATIAGDSKSSLGDAIRDSYIKGPAMKLRSFYRWAKTHYNDTIGLSATALSAEPDINPDLVAAHIPHDPGKTISVQSVSIDPADHEIWAEQWVLDNAPSSFNGAWSSDYNETTNQVTVILPDSSVHSFTPANFSKNATYLNATYNQVTVDTTLPTVTGPTTTLEPSDSFPSTTGWVTDSFSSTSHDTPEPWTETHGVYSKTDLTTEDGTGRVYSTHRVMYQDKTGPTTRTWRIDTTQTTVVGYSALKIFIYKIGSGNAALDSLLTTAPEDADGFFPPIPVRVDNKFVSDSYLPEQYSAAKAAYKKLMGRDKFDFLIDKLADNENLADIDYAFVVPGVSLNVADNSCRKYLYKFFASQSSIYDEADYEAWRENTEENISFMDQWLSWMNAQSEPTDPLYGSPEPIRGAYGSAPVNEVRIRTTAPGLGYDTRISWGAIKEETGSGLAKPGAKVGEVWLSYGELRSDVGIFYGGILGTLLAQDKENRDLYITWQTGPNSWRKVTVRNLVHQNFIYDGKYVEIKVEEALDDEEESGFIIPIHYETWKSMSLRDSTQMTSASLFLVVNSYKVVKKKWYQTGIFKIFLFVAIIVLSIIFPPAGLAGASALTIATFVATNIIITMILGKITTAALTAIFGEKITRILTVVAAFVTMNPAAFFKDGAFNLASLAKAENLLALTNVISQAVSAIIEIDVLKIAGQTEAMMNSYEKASKEIAELYAKNFGDPGVINPMALIDASNTSRYVVEPSNVFLTRTLMTGSDIADLSMSMVSDFTALTLNTELPV